jgi:hypothetical protein
MESDRPYYPSRKIGEPPYSACYYKDRWPRSLLPRHAKTSSTAITGIFRTWVPCLAIILLNHILRHV